MLDKNRDGTTVTGLPFLLEWISTGDFVRSIIIWYDFFFFFTFFYVIQLLEFSDVSDCSELGNLQFPLRLISIVMPLLCQKRVKLKKKMVLRKGLNYKPVAKNVYLVMILVMKYKNFFIHCINF